MIRAGAELVRELSNWNEELSQRKDELAGAESVFVGQLHSGEIYNQYPRECVLEGTRRWVPGADEDEVKAQFLARVQRVADRYDVEAAVDYKLIRGAFDLDQDHALVKSFNRACEQVCGHRLTTAAKPFVDDGNSFWSIANVPTVTHGPRAAGQHTVNEWISIEDMVRTAAVYVATSVDFCARKSS